MKARVKHNNEIIDVIQVGTKTHLYDLNNVEIIDEPDYWTRLEHQYAGMAMQGLCANANFRKEIFEGMVAPYAYRIAHALVVRLKEKEERK